MAATNQETPGLAAEGFEITSTTSKEQNMNETTVREPIRPIYGPSDIRWDELAAWFEIHGDEVRATIEDSSPLERAQWHEFHVRGGDWMEILQREVEWPDFPRGVKPPAWSKRREDRGIDPETEFPMHVFYVDLAAETSMASSMEQEARFDPETNTVLWEAPRLIVWADGDTRVLFERPEKAWQLRTLLHDGAQAFERVLDEAQR